MEFLSEDRIKRAGLKFLRSHYRQRERSGSGKTHSRYDVVTEGGIIADGHLSFIATDGVPFTATLEATSALTKEEVKFKIQYKVLIWDSIAVSAILSALGFSYGYVFKYFSIKEVGLIPAVVLLLICMFFIGILYQRLFRWKNRYHYIYAIEQFKKYHADEQWIAIGEDVFEHPEDEVLLELKEQCVLNGFGLIEIDFEEKGKLLITPSRHEVFGKKRDKLSFGIRDAASSRGTVARFNQAWNEKVAGKIPIPGKEQLNRYQMGFLPQALLSSFALLLIGGIFHVELQQNEIVYINEKEYQDSMQRFSLKTFPEVDEFILDTPFVDAADITAGYISEDIDEEDDFSQNINTDFSSEIDEEDILEIQAIPNEPFQVIISDDVGRQTRYDCERLFNVKGRFYLVLDNMYTNPREALKRVAKLSTAEIPSTAFSMSCFDPKDRRYLVFYDLFSANKNDAVQAAKVYRQLLKKKGFSNTKVTIRSIEINR